MKLILSHCDTKSQRDAIEKSERIGQYSMPGIESPKEKEFIKRACEKFKITYELIKSKTKKREVVELRYCLINCFVFDFKLTREAIGEIIKRNHSSVTTGLRRSADFAKTDMQFKKKLETVKSISIKVNGSEKEKN